MKISKKMGISEIMNANPEAVGVLFEAGLGCIGCHFSQMETLEQGMKAHGFSDEEIDKIVGKLNNLGENKREKRKK